MILLCYSLSCFYQNGSDMGHNRSGMVPDHSRTLLDLLGFCFCACCVRCKKKRQNMLSNHDTSTGRETILSWELMKLIQKNVHRHNSDFDGPMNFPSFIWIPFVKKHKSVITTILRVTLSTQYSVLRTQY